MTTLMLLPPVVDHGLRILKYVPVRTVWAVLLGVPTAG